MKNKNQSKFKTFFIKRAKRSWIIVIGILIALIVGGVYIAPDLVRKVQQTFASKKAIEHRSWSGGPGQDITAESGTDKYDTSFNIDTTEGDSIKLKTLNGQTSKLND